MKSSEKSECSSLVLHAVQENTFRRKTEFSLNYAIHFSAKAASGEGVVVNGSAMVAFWLVCEWEIAIRKTVFVEIVLRQSLQCKFRGGREDFLLFGCKFFLARVFLMENVPKSFRNFVNEIKNNYY